MENARPSSAPGRRPRSRSRSRRLAPPRRRCRRKRRRAVGGWGPRTASAEAGGRGAVEGGERRRGGEEQMRRRLECWVVTRWPPMGAYRGRRQLKPEFPVGVWARRILVARRGVAELLRASDRSDGGRRRLRWLSGRWAGPKWCVEHSRQSGPIKNRCPFGPSVSSPVRQWILAASTATFLSFTKKP